MVTSTEKSKEVLNYLNEIPDPEIPVISIVELGLIRNIQITEEKVEITITPTYSGCAAINLIEGDIVNLLHEKGFDNIEITKKYSPAWTTDWLSDESKEKLKKFGISPPEKTNMPGVDIETAQCPYCNSTNTKMKSWYGSTPCKSLYYCNNCSQPFEKFKSF